MIRGLGLLLLLLVLSVHAAIETFVFDNEVLERRYRAMLGELRCPKCQNQSLHDSDAPIATDLRRELHRLLHEGYSDREIHEFMVARYGDFVLYRPPLNRTTLALWGLPPLLLMVGLFAVWRLSRLNATEEPPAPLDEARRRRLDKLFEDDPQ